VGIVACNAPEQDNKFNIRTRGFTMVALKDLKTDRINIELKSGGTAEAAYKAGVKILDFYKMQPSITRLDQAGKKFAEALGYDAEHVPSMIYVSFILYALGNEPLALKYLNRAEQLTSPLPDELDRYKNAIEKRIAAKFNIK
jgi:hypothetical protein